MAITRLPLVINGVDFTRAASILAYHITYEDRAGENATTLKNGDEYLDIMTARPVINWALNALWSDELAALKVAIRGAVYVPVYYFDTELNAGATGYFHGSLGTEQVGLIRSANEILFKDGTVLTLRSR